MQRRRDAPTNVFGTPVSTVERPPMALTRADVEVANRGADAFLRLYYRACDSTTRAVDLPKFYRATSQISWNGNKLEGADAVRDFATKIPKSHHEVQSFDAHPVPGTTPPALLITVSGTVMHGADPKRVPETKKGKVDEQPRVFSQAFLLLQDEEPAPEGTEGPPGANNGKKDDANKGPRYYIKTDTLRFVG